MLAKLYLCLGSALLVLYAMSGFLGWEYTGSALSRPAAGAAPGGPGISRTGFRGGK